jgi:predicted AlkP superfamily pyrophosphatase or phosphodiesterase
MRRLMREGAFTLAARAVFPTVSSPNWASMIMGAGPEQHGVTSNEWETNKFEISPVEKGPGGIFPTIFGVVREQRPAAVIACFHDWDGFGRLLEQNAPDVIEHPEGPTNTMLRAIDCIRAKRPNFLFVHLDHVDHAGHEHGWNSPEYLAAIEVADRLIGQAMDALNEAGMMDRTVVLITADHGGKGKKHGGMTMEEIEIPWILWGAGVAHGKELMTHLNTYDTAPTIAYALGLKTPDCWIGKPVIEAFLPAAAAKREE